MARFKNSNRHAADQMAQTTSRKMQRLGFEDIEKSYFRRLGFDHAMI